MVLHTHTDVSMKPEILVVKTIDYTQYETLTVGQWLILKIHIPGSHDLGRFLLSSQA